MVEHTNKKNREANKVSQQSVTQADDYAESDWFERLPTPDIRHPYVFSPQNVLHLQSMIGNQAVLRLMRRKPPLERSFPAQSFLQRKITPEDVSEEMKGMIFEVVEDVIVDGSVSGVAKKLPLSKGDRIQIEAWDNTLEKITAKPLKGADADKTHLMVPKVAIEPTYKKVKGVAKYSSGLDKVRKDFKLGQKRIEDEKNRKGGARRGEVPRLEKLQETRQKLLNKRLIQEAMFNRFDETIKKWVDHYNKAQGHEKKDPLDPNLVKSMLFQESQMGTSGQHLEVPPSHPVKTRFNLGQVIDSSASALLVMMREERPDLIKKHGLEDIEKKRGSKGEAFYWKQANFVNAMDEFFKSVAAGQPERNVDYEFWIKIAVHWLFHKRASAKSWSEAIRAYNGSGKRAEHYRDVVKKRARAASSDKDFVPDKI